MGYYAVDANGYVDDVASIGGWSDFVAAASKLDGVADFVRDGITEDPGALGEALDAVTFPGASANSVREHLAELALNAQGFLIITDGCGANDAAVAMAEWDENLHPRDDAGRFQSIGVSGITPNRYLSQSLDALKMGGNWKLRLIKKRDDWDDTHEYAIEPMTIPPHVLTSPKGKLYDPEIATVDDEGYVRPKIGGEWHEDVQASKDSGLLFRGMSAGEFKQIQRTGIVQSAGDYNLGDAEKGVTYFSTDPAQAQHYSNGFAPWQFVASFGRPAYVVAIKDPGNAKIAHDTERGIEGKVDASKITEVWEGRPYEIDPGRIDFYNSRRPEYTEGSRYSPSAHLVWRKTTLKRALRELALAEWDESLHPRADDGKFTSGGGGDRVSDTTYYAGSPDEAYAEFESPFDDSMKIGETTNVRKTLADAESVIRGFDYEMGVVITKDGSVHKMTSNTQGFVDLDKNIDYTDATFTHNHPSSEKNFDRVELSLPDASTAVKRNMREIRAVGESGEAASLSREGPSWPGELAIVMRQIEQDVQDDFEELIRSKKMTAEQADRSHYAEVWKRTAARFSKQGVVYTHERLAH